MDALLPAPAAGDPKAAASAITQASGTSFAAGMAILPQERREAMHAIYAFCRIVDDIADGPWSASEKHHGLDKWREEIEALYAGLPRSPIGMALQPGVDAYHLPKDEFHGMIDGMAMDADGPIVAPTREELAQYTRCVAGTVGVLSIRVFGAFIGEESDRFALALGDALQLTNILRDVEEDAEIGRCYLPQELLNGYGLVDASPLEVSVSSALPAIRRKLGQEAKEKYNEARMLAPLHERKHLRPALMMMGAYEGYLRQMERLKWRFDGDTKLMGKWQKLFRGLRYAALGPGAPASA